jgi:hypothetical protein
MASPPITIAPFTNVPAPGSAIQSAWAQDITNYVAGRVLPYYATTTARDDPSTGLVGAARRVGSACIVGTATGTTTGMPRVYTWDGSTWQLQSWWAGGSGGATRPGVELSLAGPISNVTNTDLTSWTEVRDPDGWYPGAGTTLTVPAGMGGLYAVTFSGIWSTIPGTSSGGSLVVNGTGVAGCASSPQYTFAATYVAPLAAGATIRAQVYQNSGGNCTCTMRLNVARFGP